MAVLRAPAIQALIIQIACLASLLGLASMTEFQLTIAHAALLQGAGAALIAWLRRMAPWWLVIQFFFPVALLVLHALQLPPSFYLACFLALLFLYWSTFRTQVPYYPSTRRTWDSVEALLPKGRPVRCVDIGSGFGGLVMHLARLRPESEFTGIEIAPLPWLVSWVRASLSRSGASIVRGDYEDMDFADYDVVFAYLSPAAMPSLWNKARAEMRQGALLLSYEFLIPDVEPDLVIRPAKSGRLLYGWRF